MNEADHRNYWQLTSCSLYTSITAVLKLMNTPHASIYAGVLIGICIAILNMNTLPNTNVVDFPLHEPSILFPLPRAQSTLPHELVLVGTTIPEVNLHMRMHGRMRSKYCGKKSVTYPFRGILLVARLFPE